MGFSAGLFLPTTWLSDLGALSYVGIMGMLSAFGLTGEQPGLTAAVLHSSELSIEGPRFMDTMGMLTGFGLRDWGQAHVSLLLRERLQPAACLHCPEGMGEHVARTCS